MREEGSGEEGVDRDRNDERLKYKDSTYKEI